MVRFPNLLPIRCAGTPTQHVEADVCVFGAGAAGLSAALEARALGLSVALVDAAPQVGGQAVGSAIGTICGLYSNGPDPQRVVHGEMDDLLASMIAQGQAGPRRARNTVIIDYAINAWQRWAENRLLQTGVTPVFGVLLQGIERKGPRLESLRLLSRFGEMSLHAQHYIDASGDAVLPWQAGLELNASDEPIHGTVMAVFEGVDTVACAQLSRADFHAAMRSRGDEFGLVRHDGFIFPLAGTDRVLLNQTHVETPMEPVGLALAGIEGRRQVDALLALYQAEYPAVFGAAQVALYGQAGIRQTRSVLGRARLTVDEVRRGHRHVDAVLRCSWPIELHTTMSDTYWEVFDDTHMHHLPFGAMQPVGLDNVVVAGRCVDAEPAALASVRVMGACFAMGRAAASAVRLAGSDAIDAVDTSALQQMLASNLAGGTRDAWLAQIVAERGPEAGR